jgi:hypothetical protein
LQFKTQVADSADLNYQQFDLNYQVPCVVAVYYWALLFAIEPKDKRDPNPNF